MAAQHERIEFSPAHLLRLHDAFRAPQHRIARHIPRRELRRPVRAVRHERTARVMLRIDAQRLKRGALHPTDEIAVPLAARDLRGRY